MHLQYKKPKQKIQILERTSKHMEPHLHSSLELVYVTEGTLELGMGMDLFHMEKGDLGFIFPDVIHHYQVFGTGIHKAYYIQIFPSSVGIFCEKLQKYAPKNPVIKVKQLSIELKNIMEALAHTPEENEKIIEAYLQIILAKCLPQLSLIDKQKIASSHLEYQVISYVSAHFREPISLEKTAKDLGVNKYVLSRLFSNTFHRNFSQYLNDTRINYAVYCLESTNDRILDLCMESGFDSQRTFNRAFRERFHMTPSEYRNRFREPG